MTTYLHPPIGLSKSWLTVALACLLAWEGRAQTDLFISEYVESAGDKCIEIFNPTDASISLDGVYRITMGFNGGALVTKSNLTGSIGPKGTHVVCTSGSSFSFDQSMGAVGHNGNDAIVLEKNMSPIDIIGNIGCDPGTEWTSGGLSTKGRTLVRKGCIFEGNDNDPADVPCLFPSLGSEWLGFGNGDLSHLGQHGFLAGVLTASTNAPSDCGSSDGSITIMANGVNLEYSIDGVAGPFSIDPLFQSLPAGSYIVVARVIDDPTCLLTTNATITDWTTT